MKDLKLNEALKNNICGKVKRVLKEGTIEVYETKGLGGRNGNHGFISAKQQEPSYQSQNFFTSGNYKERSGVSPGY